MMDVFRKLAASLHDHRLVWLGAAVALGGFALGFVVASLTRGETDRLAGGFEGPAGQESVADATAIGSEPPLVMPDSMPKPSDFSDESAYRHVPPLRPGAGDWVDSLPVPAWVIDPRLAFRRSDDQPAVFDDAASASSRGDRVPPLLAVRLGGSDVALADLGLSAERPSVAVFRLYSRYRLLSDCRSEIEAREFSERDGIVYGRGVLRDRGGEWLFQLVAPAHRCEVERARGYSMRLPSDVERNLVLRAFAPMSDPFSGRDVKDFAASQVAEDGTRYLWGVVRRSGGTQLVPPPPVMQVGFLVRHKPGTPPAVLWSYRIDSPTARLGLAAVYDTDSDRLPEGLFIYRDGLSIRLLRVGLEPGGEWTLLDERPLTLVLE